ncbi:MAG: DUF4007 family protein [Syntrophorhabdus sp.]
MEGAEKIYETTTQINPVFARHETFHPRFGWLKKGFDKVALDGSLFKSDEASVKLGVGKNMVKSIRYWCTAFKIIEENGNSKGEFQPTTFAMNLLSDDGWDPFLENPASLWLLHWHLFKPPCDTPVWYLAFNEFNQIEFTVDDLILASKEFKMRLFPKKRLSDLSIGKDVNCLLRMYVERNNLKQLKEDSLDSPFTQLNLINTFGDSKRFMFNFSNKSTLPPEIIVWACLDYSSNSDNDARTISLSRLLYEARSPGQVLKITEALLCDAIEKVSKSFRDIALTDTAGMIQFAFKSKADDLADDLLKRYFRKR